MKNYSLLDRRDLPEIKSEGFVYTHEASGAVIIHIKNDDSRKLFCAAFRTPPPDSSGVPHIIEHSVLSGSRKYPLKDPQFDQ